MILKDAKVSVMVEEDLGTTQSPNGHKVTIARTDEGMLKVTGKMPAVIAWLTQINFMDDSDVLNYLPTFEVEPEVKTGRCFTSSQHGNTAAEIEASAINEAREVFGPDTRLWVEPSYTVVRNTIGSLHTEKFRASIYVREVI